MLNRGRGPLASVASLGNTLGSHAVIIEVGGKLCPPAYPSGANESKSISSVILRTSATKVNPIERIRSEAARARCRQPVLAHQSNYGSSKSSAYTSWEPTSRMTSGSPLGVRPSQGRPPHTTRRKFFRLATCSTL
jgi:hypothetical protein